MDKYNGMLIGSFLGDAFALALHQIYDTDLIKKLFTDFTRLQSPFENSFHKNKIKGDFTHYGDQTFNMLDLLWQKKELNEKVFVENFKIFMKDYSGYMDCATKDTLSFLDKGVVKGSFSNELGGALRMSPILYFKRNDRELAKKLVVTQTKMTHDNEQLLEISEFIVDITFAVLDGLKPSQAIDKSSFNYSNFIKEMILKAKESVLRDTTEVIKEFGQSSSSTNAFPSLIYLLLKYESNLKEALVANVLAGGDSAARGMMLGMILGAYVGEEKLPKDWLLDINKMDKILWYIS